MKKVLLTILTVMTVLVMCCKKEEGLNKTYLLSTITRGTVNINYEYDSKGRLIKITQEGTNAATLFTYDNNDRLIKSEQTYTDGSPIATDHYTYTDNTINIKHDQQSQFIFSVHNTPNKLTVNSKNQIIQQEWDNQNGEPLVISDYTYDKSGNSITIKESFPNSSTQPHTYNYTFDKKRNPFSDIKGFIPYIGICGRTGVHNCSGRLGLGNNILKGESPFSIRYEYNEDGYPTKKLENGVVKETYKYIIR